MIKNMFLEANLFVCNKTHKYPNLKAKEISVAVLFTYHTLLN